MTMSLNSSLDNGVKETQTNNGEGLLPDTCPVGEQNQPGRHETTARKEWTEEDKFAITCYLKSQSGYRKRIDQYWMEKGSLRLRCNTELVRLEVY